MHNIEVFIQAHSFRLSLLSVLLVALGMVIGPQLAAQTGLPFLVAFLVPTFITAGFALALALFLVVMVMVAQGWVNLIDTFKR